MISTLLYTGIIWLSCLILYYLLFANKTFFRWNRIYLLCSLALGLILPWISIPVLTSGVQEGIVGNVNVGIQTASIVLEEVIVLGQAQPGWNVIEMVLLIIGVGMLVKLLRISYGLLAILRLRMQGKKTQYDKYEIIHSGKKHMPFSFLNAIYIGNINALSKEDEVHIIQHEIVHLEQGHSWDVLAMELLLIPFWWFPPLYLYKKELRRIHEFLADESILTKMSSQNYKALLLRYIFPNHFPNLVHSFTNFQLKKRLQMMSRNPSSKSQKIFYLAIIPMVLLLMSFVPNTTHTSFDLSFAEQVEMGDPVDEQKVHALVGESIKKLTEEPGNESVFKVLLAQIDKLKMDYPERHGELLNVMSPMFKEVEGIYVSIKDGSLSARRAKVSEGLMKEPTQLPYFSGCDEGTKEEIEECRNHKLLMAVYSNIKYPQMARENGHEGMVVIKFVVNKEGTTEDLEIVRSVPGGCNDEVVRVVKDLQFVPGSHNGKTVNTVFHLPVKFKLEGGGKQKNKDKEKNKEKSKMKNK